MTEPNWRRIEPENHAWLSNRAAEAAAEGDRDYDKYTRYYVPESRDRRQWPLLSLTVLPRYRTGELKAAGRHNIAVGASIKHGKDDWFDETYGIPGELLDDLAEMFAAVIAEAKAL